MRKMKPAHQTTICLLLQALIQIEGQIQISTCGRLNKKYLTPHLAHGFSSNHHWPWHAAIYHQIGKFDHEYQCGGTVISARSVLTAAHCVSANNAELDLQLVTIALGRLNLAINESSAQWFGVSNILLHPDYSSIDFPNDIAIIRLSAHAIFNNYVQPICLWKSDKTDILEVVGKVGIVIGWGITENGTVSSVLQQANYPVVNFYTCVKSNPPFFGEIVTEKSFCAGNRNGTGLCQGDSGGSIAFEENGIYYIRGIVSVGQRKPNPITQELECDLTQYAVFTDVAQFLPWIIEKTTIEREPTAPINRELPPPIFRQPSTINVESDFSICGQLSPRATPLITNSYDAQHWPWHAAIYHVTDDSVPQYKCGGTVISTKAILTTARCLGIGANKLSVSLGRLNLGVNENSDQTFQVAEVVVHPEYDKEFLHNDIAIIKLSTDATFNRYVRPVCLWNSSNAELSEIVGKVGRIVGWGLTATGKLSNVLQEATAPVVDYLTCLESNFDLLELYLTETNFCAGHLNGTGLCMGDTGGSMTLEQNGIYYIRGIASFGPIRRNPAAGPVACDPRQYFVFADVAKYLQWIKDNQ